MEYQSPAAAFSNSVADYEFKRQAQQLAATREAREQQMAMDEHQERVAALEEKRQEARERMRERERGDVEKTVANMEPGDIPDADLMENARKYHVPIRLQPPKPMVPATPEGIAAPGVSTGAENVPPTGTGVLKDQPQQQVYAGNAKQRREQDIEKLGQSIQTMKPGSPEFRQAAMQYEMLKNGQIPAELLKGPGGDSEPVMTREEALARGTVPKGARIIEPLQPKDTTARDMAEAGRKDKALATVHEEAVKELDKWSTPIETQIKGINDLGIMINQKTPQADALIAPLILKSTISGTGSGFRMTRAEIENVVGGRSKWESLQAALNKWNTDPTKALSVTDEQRQEMRDLAKEIRKKATATSRKITDIRHQMDDAEDPKTINKLRTKLQEELMKDDEDESSDGVPVIGSTFNGGKVLKVTPIK